MNQMTAVLKKSARRARGVVGRAQIASADVDGVAPTAVVTALKQAMLGLPDRSERSWIRRIELMRALLSTSGAELQIGDLGAGDGNRFVDGPTTQVRTITKSLGKMTGASKPPRWAYLLFRLVRELKPESVLEMGSCVGISAAYQAAALELNGRGRLITLEGADVLAERSAHTLSELELSHRAEVRLGSFTDTLAKSIAELSPVGYAFIDGNHVEQATIDYKDDIVEAAAAEAVLVFDDINWSDGMRRAWQTIAADPRFALTVDLGPVGIAVLSASATGRHALSVRYG